MPNGTVQEALDFYRSHLGMHEEPPGSNRNAITHEFGMDGYAWCDQTFSLAMKHAGVPVPPMAACLVSERWFRDHNMMIPKPIVGAAALYHWNHARDAHHIEIVESVGKNGQYVALGGNVQDAVRRVIRSVHSSYAVVFAMPPYKTFVPPTGIHADLYTAADHPLSRGNKSKNAEQLQINLNFVTGRGLKVDGDFGPATQQCVADLQRILKLPVTGVYDAPTHLWLQTILDEKKPK